MTELPGFATTVEEIRAAADEQRRLTRELGYARRRICVCGHPVARHDEMRGRAVCTPTRMTCPCREVIAVLEVQDIRAFIRKTRGGGVDHALMRGVEGLVSKGKRWEWVEGYPLCGRCGKPGVPVLPFAIDRRGRPSEEPEAINVLLCEECVRGLG